VKKYENKTNKPNFLYLLQVMGRQKAIPMKKRLNNVNRKKHFLRKQKKQPKKLLKNVKSGLFLVLCFHAGFTNLEIG
jgi:hypothetical protein